LRRHLASLWIKKRMNALRFSRNCKADEDNDPRKVNIAKIEGQRDLEGPRVELPFIG
jgi:hypothetical protein